MRKEMCVMERFVKSWMRWEGHVESINIDEDCLPGKMYAHQERERRYLLLHLIASRGTPRRQL